MVISELSGVEFLGKYLEITISGKFENSDKNYMCKLFSQIYFWENFNMEKPYYKVMSILPTLAKSGVQGVGENRTMVRMTAKNDRDCRDCHCLLTVPLLGNDNDSSTFHCHCHCCADPYRMPRRNFLSL